MHSLTAQPTQPLCVPSMLLSRFFQQWRTSRGVLRDEGPLVCLRGDLPQSVSMAAGRVSHVASMGRQPGFRCKDAWLLL